ncbi:MAG: hypothetical protein IV103_05075 [Zoogloea sp.]|jgi:hypothetical protein|nr:hypothetical protein [Zoogloea sp.]
MKKAQTIGQVLAVLHHAADDSTGTAEGELLRDAARAIGILHEIIEEARSALRTGVQAVYRYEGEPNSVTGYEAARRLLEMGGSIPPRPLVKEGAAA